MTARKPKVLSKPKFDKASWNSVHKKAIDQSDVSCTRDEFVASMVKSHGAWIGPVITRWLDTDTPHTPSWGLTDAEILRAWGAAVDDEDREAVA